MSIDNSANARVNLSSPSGRALRDQGSRRTGNDCLPTSAQAAMSRGGPKQFQFREVLIQSIIEPVSNASTLSHGASDATISSENPAPDQALANFVQDLFAALGRSAGNSGDLSPSAENAGLTKEVLASSLEDAKSSDSNRYDRNLALLNNFDTADTDRDGAISHAEAHAFNEANGIPTIENGAAVPPDQASGTQAYRPAFSAQMAANLQDLIQQLASTSSTSTANTETAIEGTTSSASNPLLNSLEISYGNLLTAFGSDSSTGSLAHFLETLKSNLGSVGPTGNVVNTMA